MLLRFADLKGMEVLAEKEGKLLGSIRRLQIDSKRKTVLGIVFKGRGLSSEHWTNVKAIKRVGQDVIFLSDMKAVLDDIPKGRDVKDLLGLPVTSLDGKSLGSLSDVIVDPQKWSVVALSLDNGGEIEVMPEAVFGEDTVLLQKGAAGLVQKGKSSKAGFLSRVFGAEDDKEEQTSQSKAGKKTTKSRKKKKS
jgi:sporulation protein YlmC with PRC-barrel domain